ncbi:DHHA1 domain-containing protein [Balamuthia mandrillaris]
MKKSQVSVLYHCPCPDGAFAALAAYLHFSKRDVDLKFVPHFTYNAIDVESHPALTTGNPDVYLLDYCGPADFIPRLSALPVNKVVLLDHHKTAIEMIEEYKQQNRMPSNVEVSLDYDRSGATIAWDYFEQQGKMVEDDAELKRLQEMFAYIEDNDLWRKALPNSKEFSVGLAELRLDYDFTNNPELFTQLLSLETNKLIESGKVLVKQQQELIDADISRASPVALGGQDSGFGQCLGVVTANPNLRSELGNQLAKKSLQAGLRGIAALAYEEPAMKDAEKMYKVSLRSLSDDTTAISSKYGGGGHAKASSFLLEKTRWQEWVDAASTL